MTLRPSNDRITAKNPSAALTFHFDVANIGHLFLQFRQSNNGRGSWKDRQSILYDEFYLNFG